MSVDTNDGEAEPPLSWSDVQREALSDIFLQWLNLLLIFVPIGLAAKKYEMSSAVIFGCNFFAIIPLASLLGAATEALAVHTGQILGGLLNATFGNAVEMIMCVQAVKAGLIHVVQSNLLGSVLSNLLLVLGMAICASGLVRHKQEFNAQGAAANMTCQLVASISICLPTVFDSAVGSAHEVLAVSRICSIFLMAVYGLFLYFMLNTHAELFQDEGGEEEEEGGLSPTLSVILLSMSTLIVAACSECLVDSIEDVSKHYGLPKAFIGTILLPIVGNAAEHSTAVSCAYKGMMDLALGVAVGSSTQIALFVVPCAVMFGWIFDKPMDLAFQKFQMLCLLLSVFLVSQVLQHGNVNWLHGAMLIVVYLFIATQCCYIREP
jgi:Ca2+:H+ antiporter